MQQVKVLLFPEYQTSVGPADYILFVNIFTFYRKDEYVATSSASHSNTISAGKSLLKGETNKLYQQSLFKK